MTGTGPAVWVTTGPGIPCGARPTGVMGDARPGQAWLDVCMIGQHLPQQYRTGEIRELTAAGCGRLGLCPDCLGFGDLGESPAGMLGAARGVDQLARPCPGCDGSGRPALRITLQRDPSGVTGELRPLPHSYVPPLDGTDPEVAALFGVPEGMCLACGMPPGGAWPGGEVLHPQAAA